jgi:hypothetical protein
MTITLNLPEDIARQLSAQGQDLSRAALELLVLEAYRERKISTAQARRLLGFETRYELDGFLKEHGVWLEYTQEDFEREGQISQALRQKRQQELAQESQREHP